MDPIPHASLAAHDLGFAPLPPDPAHLSREEAVQAAKPMLSRAFLPSSRVSAMYGVLYGITLYGAARPGSDRAVWLVLVRNLGRKHMTKGGVWGRCVAVDALTSQTIVAFEATAAPSPREVQSRAERLAEFTERRCDPALDAYLDAVEVWRAAVEDIRAAAERVNDRGIEAALRATPEEPVRAEEGPVDGDLAHAGEPR